MFSKLVDSLFDPMKKISYRRLLAWAAGTWLVYVDKITDDTWMWVTIAFIAGESAKLLRPPGDLGVSSRPVHPHEQRRSDAGEPLGELGSAPVVPR